MTETLDAREFQSRLGRLDALLREAEDAADRAAAARTREIVRAILDLHGSGLERILGHVEAAGPAAATILDACARDDVVEGLLLLHGLHPLALEDRVVRALDQVRPGLRSHGGDVELLGVDGGVVRLRLVGNCHGCPSSAATMRQTVEEAILGKAPDAVGIEVEGMVEDPGPSMTPDGRPLVVLSAP